MKAMVFAAGLGTRLRPLTDTMPKALVPINGTPLLEHVLVKIKQAGILEVVVNVHHFSQQIIDFLEEKQNFGISIQISDESNELLETGGGLRKALTLLGENEPILLHNVDILSNLNLSELITTHQATDGATLVVSKRNTSRYLLFDKNMALAGWHNVKTNELRPSSVNWESLHALAFSGIQIVSPQLLSSMADMPKRFSIIDFYLKMMNTTPIRAYIPSDYRMIDVGKIDTLNTAEEFIQTL
jgi:NDP-sugar pyrophosphorylase family protein